MVRVLAIFALFMLPGILPAHDAITTKLTWTREVSRLIYKRCASCHHEGGPSFSLMKYEEARPWAKAIEEEVLRRRMPPWNAVKGFGEFKNDSGLPQEEIETIGDWVEGGAPEGDPRYLPPAPRFDPQQKKDQSSDRKITLSGSKVIEQAMEVIGIRPAVVPSNGVLQAIAQMPDGRIEPLLWVQKFNPSFDGVYYFRTVLRFTKGTRIEVTPATASVNLLIKR